MDQKGKILTWLKAQNYTKAQLQSVTRAQVKVIAENHNLNVVQIRRLMGSYHTLLNAVWSDWRKKRIETAMGILKAKVREYDADAVVLYMGQERSSVDPEKMISVFTVETDLELER